MSGDIGVIFEDGHLIGLIKPPGLPTANAPRGSGSVYVWLQRRFGADAFVGIVSRLDAPVSGVVVVAKTPAAAGRLAGQFRDRTVAKDYVAVVEGRFPAPLGQYVDWHDAIARRGDEPRSTLERNVPPGDVAGEEDDETAAGGLIARPAHVRTRVVRRAGEVSFVELEPSTGRRHQLRVQLAARGCPIVGDRLYGARLPYPHGIALHARRLTFEHPRTGVPVVLEAGPPSAWKDRFPALFRGGAAG